MSEPPKPGSGPRWTRTKLLPVPKLLSPTAWQVRAWRWGQNSCFALEMGVQGEPCEGASAPTLGRPPPRWAEGIGAAAFTPPGRPQRKGHTALLPASLTRERALMSPRSDKPAPPFPSLQRPTSESAMGPPTLRRHLGGPQLPSGGCKPSRPQLPITCWQRGEDQPLSDSHGPAASPKAPSPLTSSPSPAGARRPSGEQRRAPRMRARAPCRRRSLFLAACPGFLPHEQTLEKLVHSSRTTARASDKPRWLPAIPGMEGPCSGCPWPPVPRDRVGNGMLSPSAGGGVGSCGLGDVVRGASDGQGFVTRCPGSPG